MPEPGQPVDYRLAPSLTVRFVGLAVVGLALLLFAATAVVAIAGLNPVVLVVLLVAGLAGVFVLGWYLRSRGWVLRCTDDGYRVRMVRGAGVSHARWSEVEDAVTTTHSGVPCVVLRLREGGATTIPVGVLDVDREQFVRELQGRLQRASGLRPWRGPDETAVPPGDSAPDKPGL